MSVASSCCTIASRELSWSSDHDRWFARGMKPDEHTNFVFCPYCGRRLHVIITAHLLGIKFKPEGVVTFFETEENEWELKIDADRVFNFLQSVGTRRDKTSGEVTMKIEVRVDAGREAVGVSKPIRFGNFLAVHS